MKKWRERNAASNAVVTPTSQPGNGSVRIPPAPSPLGEREAKALRKKELEKDFEVFWEKYPRKIARELAHRTWMSLAPTPPQVARILEAIARQSLAPGALSRSKIEGSKDFRPHPSSWLNAGRWTTMANPGGFTAGYPCPSGQERRRGELELARHEIDRPQLDAAGSAGCSHSLQVGA